MVDEMSFCCLELVEIRHFKVKLPVRVLDMSILLEGIGSSHRRRSKNSSTCIDLEISVIALHVLLVRKQ